MIWKCSFYDQTNAVFVQFLVMVKMQKKNNINQTRIIGLAWWRNTFYGVVVASTTTQDTQGKAPPLHDTPVLVNFTR